MEKQITVGLIELPAIKLIGLDGKNWTAFRMKEPLGSKQILAGSLQEHFYVTLVNLKRGNNRIKLGGVAWRQTNLRKIVVGNDWRNLAPNQYDVWGVTVNYLQEREVACAIVSYLASHGAKVVVGGSDAFAEPDPYIRAGAMAVVMDKSGASNIAAIQIAMDIKPTALSYNLRVGSKAVKSGNSRLHPEEWKIPSVDFVKKTLGYEYWEGKLEERLKPIGAVMLDQGCDRRCDFCETPNYRLGYQYMSPEKALEWVKLQKEADAKSFVCLSDQFLGRILYPEGRTDILKITNGFRKIGLPVLWGNGLDLSKVTLGHGKNSDTRPDIELIKAIWGWDGKVGCAQTYIPAERPIEGKKAYAKLLDWRSHVEILKAIVGVGVPDISYGVIMGLPDDDHNSLSRLLEAVLELKSELKKINPDLKFRVTPFAIRPIPGTFMAHQLQQLGLIRFSDPAILGGFWTACADTRFISYEEVSGWQLKILKATEDKDTWQQGFTAVH